MAFLGICGCIYCERNPFRLVWWPMVRILVVLKQSRLCLDATVAVDHVLFSPPQRVASFVQSAPPVWVRAVSFIRYCIATTMAPPLWTRNNCWGNFLDPRSSQAGFLGFGRSFRRSLQSVYLLLPTESRKIVLGLTVFLFSCTHSSEMVFLGIDRLHWLEHSILRNTRVYARRSLRPFRWNPRWLACH